jgi:hypothetical protein
MTKREFLTNVINGTITEKDIDFAKAEIEKMDNALEAKKNKVSPKDAEKAAADAVIRESIFAVVSELVQTEADIAAAVGVTGPKARAELRKLVAEGRVVSTDVKVPGKGKCKGYLLPAVEAEAEATDVE